MSTDLKRFMSPKSGMQGAEDVQILERARNEDRICVTLDHDFHLHLAVAGHGRPSVVLLRVQGLNAQGQADLIRSVCVQCKNALSDGAAISADADSIRVRRMPTVSVLGGCHSGRDGGLPMSFGLLCGRLTPRAVMD